MGQGVGGYCTATRVGKIFSTKYHAEPKKKKKNMGVISSSKIQTEVNGEKKNGT